MKIIYYAGLLLFTTIMAACNNSKQDIHSETHSEEDIHTDGTAHNDEEGAHSPDEIIISKEKAIEAGIKSSIVTPGNFNEIIKTSGKILPAIGNEQTITAPTEGNVIFIDNISEGSRVRQDGCIAHITTKKTVGTNKPDYIEVRYEIAKKEFDRASVLVKDNIISEKEYNDAKQEYEQAKIDYETLMRRKCKDGLSVAPGINGYVKNFLVKNGEYVQSGQAIMTVTQTQKLYLRADVSERDLYALPNISSANFTTSYDNKVYELGKMSGKLISSGKSVDESSVYIPVTFEFNNTGNIIPGTYAEIYLISTPLKDVISLPVTAISEEQGHFFVYKKTCEDSYKKQEVTLGNDNGKMVQILSGITPGDNIVTEGAYQIKLESASHTIPAHTHEH